MPVLRYKNPPEVLQAQVAAFAHEQPMDYELRTTVFNNIGHIAAGPHKEDITSTAVTDMMPVDAPNRNHLAKVEETVVLPRRGHADFVRENRGQESGPVAGRVELLTAYNDFAPHVNMLKAELKIQDPRKHPGYISEGGGATAFRLNVGSHEYVTILPHHPDTTGLEIDVRVAGLMRAKGVEGLEQIVAASYEDGVTISERVPGVGMDKIPLETLNDIPQKHVDKLIDTLVEARAKGVDIDYINMGNFIYDTAEGFGIVDLSATNTPISTENFAEGISRIATRLTTEGFDLTGKTKEESNAMLRESFKARIAFSDKLVRGIRKIFSRSEKQLFIDVVNNNTKYYAEKLAQI